MVHREWTYVAFESGFDLELTLVALLFVWSVWMMHRRNYKSLISIAPLASISLIPGFEIALVVSSLVAVILGLKMIAMRSYLRWTFLSLIGVECLALVNLLLFMPLGIDSLHFFSRIDLEVFYLFSFFGSFLGVSFAILSITVPLLYLLGMFRGADEGSTPIVWAARSILLPFMLIIFICVYAGLYPNLTTVNPWNNAVGSDFYEYIVAAERVDGDASMVFSVMSGSRPILFILVLGLQRLIGTDSQTIIRFLPLILNPLVALSSYFLSSEVLKDRSTSIWAALFTVGGIQLTVGMFAYYLTNMLGLCLISFSLGFLFRSLKKGRVLDLLTACFTGGLVVFTHPWTFDQYYVPILFASIFFVYDLIRKHSRDKSLYFAIVYILSLSFSELAKSFALGGVSGVGALEAPVMGIISPSQFWYSLDLCFGLLYGGLMFNLLPFAFAILGVLLLRGKGLENRFLLFLLISSSTVFFFVDGTIKSRLLYNLPLGLFSALGFRYSLNLPYVRDLRGLFSSFVAGGLVLYLFRSLSSLV